jgi:NAD(P)-dependent dehydrogenase (short-subunit alcohol dehydrogenase family)
MNPTILVTGASRGIGKAIIHRFASHGFNVAFCSINPENVDLLTAELKSLYPSISVFSKAVNMRNKSEINAFCNEAKVVLPSIDVLVNNAGVFKPGLVLDESEGLLEELIETNLYSAYSTSRMIALLMPQNTKSIIINICSVAGLKAYPNGGSYSISKFAMDGLSKTLREELKDKKIRVTTIYPGAVLTDSWAGVDIPEERFIDVEDVADIAYLAYSLSGRSVMEEVVIRPLEGDM